ncbi:hypothetical protein RB195_018047 [Necator americanus]|uniref:Endonuclease/exonuclease/phosphatase domain-containing protein n=1 Tax=Necator americanus TaxID=51031 RepID=A0ABR1C7Y5_NECAM
MIGDFNAKIGPRRTPGEFHIGTYDFQWNEQGERLSEFIMGSPSMGTRNFRSPPLYAGSHPMGDIIMKFTPSSTIIDWEFFATLAGFWEDSAMDNINEEYDILHLEYLKRQRGATRAAGNQKLTSELVMLCREAIKEDLKERRSEVPAEATEAGKSIWEQPLDGEGNVESHLRLLLSSLRQPCPLASSPSEEEGHIIPEVLLSEVRHTITSTKSRTTSWFDRTYSVPKHIKNLSAAVINTLAMLFTRYLSECKVSKQWKGSKTVLFGRREIHKTSPTTTVYRSG